MKSICIIPPGCPRALWNWSCEEVRMYEQNLTALQNWTDEFTPEFFAEFMKQETEAARIALLDTIYFKELDKFEAIPLWPAGKTPDYHPEEKHREPSVRFFPCEQAKGCVVLVPGGAYNTKSISNEGIQEARKFHEAGFAAAVLDYRIRPYAGYDSLHDLQRAIRLLRHDAAKLGFAPDRLAIAGSSAGGHLCSMAAVHWDDGKAGDAIDAVSCRPDAVILSYGVFSMVATPQMAQMVNPSREHPTSVENLDGLVSPYTCPPELRRHRAFFSPELHVTPDTPPVFMWQTCDQDDPRQIFRFATQLAENGVRFETHIFPYGAHGGGLWDGGSISTPANAHNANWFRLAVEWLEIELNRKNNG